jgi:hypothetical protein
LIRGNAVWRCEIKRRPSVKTDSLKITERG